MSQVSKTAELETRRFRHQRLAELKMTLIKYAEGQLSNANQIHTSLSDCVLKMRDFPLPSSQAKVSSSAGSVQTTLHKPE